MKYNTYNTRRPSRYQVTDTPNIGKKLVEQFLTQLILCALVISIIFGAQLLGVKHVDEGISKMKSALIYSPSLHEITQSAKDVVNIIIERISQKDMDEETIPVISIDDEVF